MQSFIKFIADVTVPYNPDWLVDPDKMFRSLSTGGKVYFLMQQAIALNYLDRVYDKGLPTLIKEYKEKVTKWWLVDLEYEVNALDTDDLSLEKEGYLNILALLNNDQSNQIDAERCSDWASHQREDAPVAMKNTFYSPYLRFAERARRSETLADGEHAQNTESFSVPGPVTLPTFTYQGEILSVRHDLSYSGYKYDYTSNHKYGTSQYGLGVGSIFSYWRGYNWTDFKFNSVVGVLAAQCLDLDTNTFPNNSLLWAYYDVYCKVTGWQPKGAGESNYIWLSSESNFLRRCVLSFLIDLRDRYKVQFDDSELLARLMQGDTAEDADQLHAFLKASEPTEVSVEMYHAFQKSPFARFDELDLIKHKRLSSRELMDATIDARNSETDPSDTQQDDDSTSGRSRRRRTSRPSSEPNLSDSSFDQLDEETGMTEDPAQPDDEDEEATETEDPNTDELSDNNFDELDQNVDTEADATTPDEEPTDPEGNPEGTEDTTHNTQHTQVPDMPDMDDKKGVKLELSAGETANSVLYRIELESFIDSLLANSPNFLSAQKVELLKRIKAYWLNRLSPESLVNLLNSIIKLPKHLNINKNKDK